MVRVHEPLAGLVSFPPRPPRLHVIRDVRHLLDRPHVHLRDHGKSAHAAAGLGSKLKREHGAERVNRSILDSVVNDRLKLLDAWRRRWRRRRGRRRRGHHLHVPLPRLRSRPTGPVDVNHEDVEPLTRRLVMPRNPRQPPLARDVVGAECGHEQAQTPRLARRVDDIVDVPRAVVRDWDERGHRAAVWKLSNRAGDLHPVGSVSSHLHVQLRRGYPVAVPEPRPRAVRRRGDAKRAGDDDAVARVALQQTRAGEGRPRRLDLRQQRISELLRAYPGVGRRHPGRVVAYRDPKRRPHLRRPRGGPRRLCERRRRHRLRLQPGGGGEFIANHRPPLRVVVHPVRAQVRDDDGGRPHVRH
mmetsp:Transcript_15054/g.63364  ORF Transcript_15054/g.63364 Transcript_15054/m.63364 type:complete len:357 (-) Transcript_15054:819-1889(-)